MTFKFAKKSTSVENASVESVQHQDKIVEVSDAKFGISPSAIVDLTAESALDKSKKRQRDCISPETDLVPQSPDNTKEKSRMSLKLSKSRRVGRI